MLAALTNAISAERRARRRGCSCSSSLGVAKNMPISSAPSRAGTSHDGPIVSRSGSSSCRTIAASTVTCAGQKGSGAAGGG